MSNTFASERERTATFNALVLSYFTLPFDPKTIRTSSASVTTDASMYFTLSNKDFQKVPVLLLNREDNNEMGSTDSEPYIQNASYYYWWYKEERYSSLLNSSLCPAFLVELVGPNIRVSGVVSYGENIFVDPLTPMIFMHFNANKSTMTQLASLFHALQQCLDKLEDYYKDLKPLPPGKSISGYPYPQSFVSSTGSIAHFEYTRMIGGPNDSSVFIADTKIFEGTIKTAIEGEAKVGDEEAKESETNLSTEDLISSFNKLGLTSTPKFDDLPSAGPIIIKFVRRYGIESHLCLSNISLAPKLYSVKYLPGGWFMIIMENIPNAYSYNIPSTSPLENQLLQGQLTKAINALHKNNFVHGDLRANNIITDGKKLWIVDFDWSGTEGKTLYPSS